MKKSKLTGAAVFLAYSLPFPFLLMYWDRQCNALLFYPLLVLCYAALGWYCGKSGRRSLAAAGSLVSCVLSLLLAQLALTEQSHYFAPFGITGMVLFLAAFSLAVQVILWRKQRGDQKASMAMQFLEALSMLFVPAVILLFAILLLPQVL